ncbi:MAG TPA: NRDE family protein [Polyangiales bacterium]|nr:NRDE family protein [Polyangiales bacterium]
MCTILYLHRVHPDFPLIVAANRDEHYARPSTAPAQIAVAPRIVAGLDKRAGGTWLGVNECGLLVGLTNQRTYMPPDPRLRSRGEVVMAALRARSLDELREVLERVRPEEHNAFNLLFGDGRELFAAYSRPETARIEIDAAPEGVNVLPNDRIGAPGFPKAERARALASALPMTAWSELAPRLGQVLGDHALPELAAVPQPPPGSTFDHATLHRMEAICLHGAEYGTCSASLIALGKRGVAHYWFADGPPCTASWRDVTALLG